ncbi:MAG: CDGSH iron-sulfur domain-containing protein [Chloroflexi bacterium]|nr:CDGSH iron-sulfur domain-containing protein [Chloroflexota bacterium]
MTFSAQAGRGSLAQVLATRGGQASHEAPFVIEHREALIYMLCEAAELEHAIMCQYLYAAFSLKQSPDEGLTPAELEAVERWRKTVSHIATQEMLHLSLVQNLLSAVGASPHLTRPNLPQPAGHYPPGVVLTLLPFGEAALRHFMFLERPEGMALEDAPGLAAVERAAPAMQDAEIVPRLQDFATVGHLYRSIEEGITHLCSKYGERWLFVGPPTAQASEQHFGWSQLVQVTNVESAQRAIDTILEQGEGPRGHWEQAHFGLFVNMLDEYERLRQANPDFEPARPVLPALVRPREGDQSIPVIGDEYTARCTDLFNVSYEILLQTLARYFAHTEETEAQLATLAQVTLGLMFNVVKPVGQLVTTLPVGGDAQGRTAGPSFELFYESDYLLPHRDAAWALIEERIREAASFAERLEAQASPDVASRLQPIGPALLELAHTLATCRAEWGGGGYAGEVTVAHRRRQAEQARTDPGVTAQVERLAVAIRSALRVEQSLALRALLAGAPVEANLRFERTLNLADLLVAVVGDTHIEAPTPSDDSNSDLAQVYAEIAGCLGAVAPEALLVDPHPAPTFAHEEQRQPLPGVVDRASALALIQQITSSPASAPVEGTVRAEPPAVADAASARVAQLFSETYAALLVVLGRGLSAETDIVAARHRLRDVAIRLHNRALRPLAAVLCQLTPDPAAALALVPHDDTSLEDRLRALAVAATTLRVDLDAAPPELLEATAALQHLALTYATPTDVDKTALLNNLRNAASAVPPSIQLAHNGPYVLTNVDQLTNGLGDPIDTRPQMALCRCGQSASKPWCDGSHALVGFDDARDPNRVADRRDTYPGVAVTIFDNRGICQHSGFCTDRLSLAFRTNQEPFVAPSGARMDELIRAVRNCPSGALSFAIDGREARDAVDWNSQRNPAVFVTNDGPYRITGAIPLIDPNATPVARNQGVSLEHYALCRCGHSQNKPFCSGMHWYIQFHDPVSDPMHRPTMYEWCGGLPALQRLTRLFFERHLPEDPLLAPLFADAPPDEPERLAALLGQAFGGPARNGDQSGDAAPLLASREFSEAERTRWVSLLCRSADGAGLPADAEFRSAFMAYLEWQSRRVSADAPRWDWGPAGAPAPARVSEPQAETVAVMPAPGEPISFETHIRPLFRQLDRQSMLFAFDLWSYDAVKPHAQAILERLRAGTMPCDGAWPAEKTDLFQRWIDAGTPA